MRCYRIHYDQAASIEVNGNGDPILLWLLPFLLSIIFFVILPRLSVKGSREEDIHGKRSSKMV